MRADVRTNEDTFLLHDNPPNRLGTMMGIAPGRQRCELDSKTQQDESRPCYAQIGGRRSFHGRACSSCEDT